MAVDDLQVKTAFPPIVGADARVLILGSMPGEASLQRQQYYGHPRNAFWPILCTLLGVAPTSDYAERVAALRAHGIALWDVIAACARSGSLDQAIRRDTIQVNDFGGFFSRAPMIERLIFNGTTAEREFGRRVLPRLLPRYQRIERHRLPSTSPAHAGMPFEKKLAAWRVLLDWLELPVLAKGSQSL
jgi:TDG/mug DNA glycosylase family protein